MSLLCIGVLTFNISGFHIAAFPANRLSYKNRGALVICRGPTLAMLQFYLLPPTSSQAA